MNDNNPTTLDNTFRGTNQIGMRAHNERLVLTLLRRDGSLSKADITRMTGLSAQTVSVIVRALEDEGFLVKGKPLKGKIGQPSIPIALASNGAFFFGLKIGRRNSELILINFVGEIIERRALQYSYPNYDDIYRFAKDSAAEISDSLAPHLKNRISGMGIALPFYLWDWADALDAPDDKIRLWKDVAIDEVLEEQLSIPVILQNDASSACAGELLFGNNTPSDFIYFHIGFFIGGGIALDNKNFNGISGNAAALGSIPIIDRDGSKRQLIEIASVEVLEKRLSENLGKKIELWENPEDWFLNEAILAHWVEQSADAIAQAIPAVISVIDVNHVVIDGWISPAITQRLVSLINDRLRDYNFAGITIPNISCGSLGCDAKVLGAASLPLSERFLINTKALMNS